MAKLTESHCLSAELFTPFRMSMHGLESIADALPTETNLPPSTPGTYRILPVAPSMSYLPTLFSYNYDRRDDSEIAATALVLP